MTHDARTKRSAAASPFDRRAASDATLHGDDVTTVMAVEELRDLNLKMDESEPLVPWRAVRRGAQEVPPAPPSEPVALTIPARSPRASGRQRRLTDVGALLPGAKRPRPRPRPCPPGGGLPLSPGTRPLGVPGRFPSSPNLAPSWGPPKTLPPAGGVGAKGIPIGLLVAAAVIFLALAGLLCALLFVLFR